MTNAAPARDPRVSRSTREPATPTRPATRPAPRTTRPSAPKPPPASRAPAPAPVAAGNPGYAQQVLDLTNAARAKAGCTALTTNAKLTAAAQAHSQDMADNDYFDHTSPNGSTPWDRAHEAGYADPSGENIAIGYQTPQDVMDAWMASDGHRANILNCDSHEMGLGYVDDPGRGPLWTQMFGFG